MKKLFQNRLNYRLAYYIFLISFSIIALIIFWPLYSYYQNDLHSTEKNLQRVFTIYRPELSENLQQYNKQALHSILKAMTLSLDEVQQIIIQVPQGEPIQYGQPIEKTYLITKDYPIYFPVNTTEKIIGTLQITVSTANHYQHFLANLFKNLLLSLFSAVFISLCLLYFLRVYLIRPLHKITQQIDNLLPDQRETVLEHCEHRFYPSELAQLTKAIEAMQYRFQQAHTRLQTSEQNMQQLLQTSPIGLGLWHFDGTLAFINTVYAQIVGHPITDNLKLNYWQNIVAQEDIAAEQRQLEVLNSGDRYGPYEKQFQHKDGYFIPVKVSGFVLERAGARYLWTCVEDITVQKRALIALQEAQQKAEETNAAKSQFLASMGHELRTPMNTIVGYSEMLEEELKECNQPHLLQDVKYIHTAAKNLLGLIDGILDIAKIEAGRMDLFIEDFDVKEMLQHVITTIQPLLENKANVLQTRWDEACLGQMHSDQTKLRQILLNLLSNASKFSEQGPINLTVERITTPAGEQVVFQVKDEGIGMTGEQRDNLLQIFAQEIDINMIRKYNGAGLGLALTKHFIQMLEGTIDLKSEFDKGNCFIVHLPVYLTKATATSLTGSLSVKKPDLPMESGTLLVIDDDEVVRQLFETYLGKVGYQIFTAHNGKEGLNLAKKIHPDIIILDVMMPGTDGWQVLSQLKADEILAHIPVIMLTMMEDKDIGYSLGASEYLTKPISRHQLLKVLRKYRPEKSSRVVMLIEDDPPTREMMIRMLNKANWRVIEAENGEIALQHLQKYHPDLILLDLMMPGIDGFEFIRCLQRQEEISLIPVVVMTAKDISAEERAWLHNRGAVVFRKGAYSREELLLDLHEVLSNAMSQSTH